MFFQNLAGLRVDANFLRHCAALNVEGIAQSGPTFFFFKLFVSDLARMRLQSDGASFSDAHLSLLANS